MISLTLYVVAVVNTWSLLVFLLKHQVALHPIPKYLLCCGYIHSLSNCGHFENEQQTIGDTCAMLRLSSSYFFTPALTPGKFIPSNIKNRPPLPPSSCKGTHCQELRYDSRIPRGTEWGGSQRIPQTCRVLKFIGRTSFLLKESSTMYCCQ